MTVEQFVFFIKSIDQGQNKFLKYCIQRVCIVKLISSIFKERTLASTSNRR